MIQHLHSVLCSRVILDKNTDLASYIDIIEGVTLTDPKHLQIPNFCLLSKFWIKDGIEDDQTLEIKISHKISDKKKWIELQIIDVPLDHKGKSILVNLSVENLKVDEIGLWEFEIKWRLQDSGNWKKAAIIPFKVSTSK